MKKRSITISGLAVLMVALLAVAIRYKHVLATRPEACVSWHMMEEPYFEGPRPLVGDHVGDEDNRA